MNKIKMWGFAAIVFALGSAFVSKSASPQSSLYKQQATPSQCVASSCLLSGQVACDWQSYQINAGSVCTTPVRSFKP